MFSPRLRMVMSSKSKRFCYSPTPFDFFFSKHSILAKNSGNPVDGNENENNITTPSDEKRKDPHLSVMTDDRLDSPPVLKTVSVIPGKGQPPEPPVTCCMSGCANCVWIAYAEELKAYYGDGDKMAEKALDHIEDPSLKAFVKLELGMK